MSTWDLIKSGSYNEACMLADKEFSETSSYFSLRNKVFALLCLEKYQEAIELSSKIIQLNEGSTDGDFIFQGVAHWLLGNYPQAIEIWKSARDTKYTDAAGGVEVPLLLFFASVFCNDDKLREQSISMLEDFIDNDSWPGPIAAFVLGKISEEELRLKMTQQPILKTRQICQAAFYMAIVQYALGKQKEFCDYLQEACGQGPVTLLEHEYYLAKDLLGKEKVSGTVY